jgi:hypothetical protein
LISAPFLNLLHSRQTAELLVKKLLLTRLPAA